MVQSTHYTSKFLEYFCTLLKTMAAWTEEMEEQPIALVEERPLLYNITLLCSFGIWMKANWWWLLAEHVSRAEQWEFLLPAYEDVHSFAPSLKIIPDSSAQRPRSAHLKFHSAPVKSLHARSNLKEGSEPGSWAGAGMLVVQFSRASAKVHPANTPPSEVLPWHPTSTYRNL